MPLLITEEEVQSLLTMPAALEAVQQAFQHVAEGNAEFQSRQRLHLRGFSYLHYMAAADGARGYMGMKIYTSSRQGLRFLIPLFQAQSGELLALIEADYLGQMRTGAASGLATRLLARSDAKIAGIIGTGLQARTQLEAIAAVRKIERAFAFGREASRRERFASEMSKRLGIPVQPAGSGQEAVEKADIVITATTASEPVLKGEWLRPGMHINAIGANFPQKRELDAQAVARANAIFADSREQSKLEAGDLIQAFEQQPSRWDSVRELADLVARRANGRKSAEDITLFKSNGIAIEDITTAAYVYEQAKIKGKGRYVEFWQERPGAQTASD